VVMGVMMWDDIVPVVVTEVPTMVMHSINMSSMLHDIGVARSMSMLSVGRCRGQQRNATCQNATCA
jgi:hypothetical protein